MIFTLRNTYISLPVVRRCVETYPQVRPEKVQELERCRFAEIPEALTERAKAGKAYLEKHELEQLMRYKL